jgi:hypothetical protein
MKGLRYVPVLCRCFTRVVGDSASTFLSGTGHNNWPVTMSRFVDVLVQGLVPSAFSGPESNAYENEKKGRRFIL